MTDGDALCYHLQVPKVFLMRGSVGFLPDLHETVYPLVTELLYALALEFRGPVACRGIQWFLGLALAANVIALARPSLGSRAWWAGAVVLLVPAVSNGMTAPLNDVALAAFGTAAIFAWTRLHDRPSYRAAIAAGLLRRAGDGRQVSRARPVRAAGGGDRAPRARPPAVDSRRRTASVGQPWHLSTSRRRSPSAAGGTCEPTCTPAIPSFRSSAPSSAGPGSTRCSTRPNGRCRSSPLNLLFSLVPLSLEPDRFDSFSHQFGPIFLLFLPALLLERAPRRVWSLALLGYLFLTLCMTQRQSMRFVLIALGPLSVGVAYLASVWCQRKTLAARCLLGVLIAGARLRGEPGGRAGAAWALGLVPARVGF